MRGKCRVCGRKMQVSGICRQCLEEAQRRAEERMASEEQDDFIVRQVLEMERQDRKS